MAGKKKRSGIEWVGGLVSMPGYVLDEAESYRPEVLVWMNLDGAVIGHSMGKPGALLAAASESLGKAITHPLVGQPHVPARVRVASAELAEVLRAAHAGIEIVNAPVPELDAFAAAMREHMSEGGEQTYLSPGVEPAAVGAMFRAAMGLFRAKPWARVPGDQSTISVKIEKLGVMDAVISVIGQMGESFGFIMFSCIEDFEAYLDAAEAMQRGERPAMPPHFALNFERGADLSADLRKEIAKHHWEVAAVDAYPWLLVVDGDLVSRPPTAKEVAIVEAIALALPMVLEEKAALQAAWDGGAAVVRTMSVGAHIGDVEVSLGIPYEHPSVEQLSSKALFAELYELGMDERLDPEARRTLEDELVRRFAASPEATALGDITTLHFVMDFAADYFHTTAVLLSPEELRTLIFTIIPRQVSIPASEAKTIIEENRAFFAFLERELGVKHAEACLRVLSGDAVAKLEAALSDKSKFGMAKSLIMAGHEAGYDMSSREGVEAWMRIAQSMPLPASIRLPSQGGAPRANDRAATRAKKAARKTARKARKKGR